MTAPITHLLYLHGFRSSPQSSKARSMAAWMARHRPDVTWLCPQLPVSPAEAIDAIAAATDGWPAARSGVIGSSLGGFYATVLAERRPAWRAVLLNPAVAPARDLSGAVGEMPAWHDPSEHIHFRAEYIDELRALTPAGALSEPQRYFAVIAKGDEVLSWREMTARYAGSRIELIEGGDHALSDFDSAHQAKVLAFLGLTPPAD